MKVYHPQHTTSTENINMYLNTTFSWKCHGSIACNIQQRKNFSFAEEEEDGSSSDEACNDTGCGQGIMSPVLFGPALNSIFIYLSPLFLWLTSLNIEHDHIHPIQMYIPVVVSKSKTFICTIQKYTNGERGRDRGRGRGTRRGRTSVRGNVRRRGRGKSGRARGRARGHPTWTVVWVENASCRCVFHPHTTISFLEKLLHYFLYRYRFYR